jgi:cell division protein FtsW
LGAAVGLILLQPDLGSASVLIACAMGLLLVAGAKWKYIASITLLATVSATAVVVSGVIKTYQIKRIEAFLNQNSTEEKLKSVVLQVRFAKRAVSTGGLTGKGFLQGPLTNGGFIPVQSTDFIFAVFAEEFGFVGSLMLLLFLVVFGFVGLRIALLCRSNQHRLVAIGCTALLVGQSILNIAVASGAIPTTGLPLPMVSYGGNSLLMSLFVAGLLIRCGLESSGLETARPRRRRPPAAPIG